MFFFLKKKEEKNIYHYIIPYPQLIFEVALWSSAIKGLNSHNVYYGGFLDLIFYNQLEFVNLSPFPLLYGPDLLLLHGSSCCTHHLWAEPLWERCLKLKEKSVSLIAKVKGLARWGEAGMNYKGSAWSWSKLNTGASSVLTSDLWDDWGIVHSRSFFRLVISLSVQFIWF